jgi:hypothetical protein
MDMAIFIKIFSFCDLATVQPFLKNTNKIFFL